jgi:hypothetical protein
MTERASAAAASLQGRFRVNNRRGGGGVRGRRVWTQERNLSITRTHNQSRKVGETRNGRPSKLGSGRWPLPNIASGLASGCPSSRMYCRWMYIHHCSRRQFPVLSVPYSLNPPQSPAHACSTPGSTDSSTTMDNWMACTLVDTLVSPLLPWRRPLSIPSCCLARSCNFC